MRATLVLLLVVSGALAFAAPSAAQLQLEGSYSPETIPDTSGSDLGDLFLLDAWYDAVLWSYPGPEELQVATQRYLDGLAQLLHAALAAFEADPTPSRQALVNAILERRALGSALAETDAESVRYYREYEQAQWRMMRRVVALYESNPTDENFAWAMSIVDEVYAAEMATSESDAQRQRVYEEYVRLVERLERLRR